MDRPGGLLGEAALALYGGLGRLAEPLAGLALRGRESRGKEDPARRGERFGRAGDARPDGALVWVHAASVGETMAMLPLILRLTGRGLQVLLTTGTVTAAGIAAQRLPAGAAHQYPPIDTPAAVRRFLAHWRPDLALFAESELWPTMLEALSRSGVPLILLNARMSERSFRAWRAMAPVARAVLGRLDLCLAQTSGDAARLGSLGARRCQVCGNMKFDAPVLPADAADLATFRQAIGSRLVFLAASTHPGEETAILSAHAELTREGRRLLTILAPRHPHRGAAIADEIRAAGRDGERRTSGDPIRPDTDIYLADTVGEMGLWFRLADVAFLGGSMVPRGGQNPIEPAKLGVPILHGMHVENFRGVYEALASAGAATAIPDAACLAGVLRGLIDDPEARATQAAAARACVGLFTGALERSLQALEPYLAALETERPHAARA